ncbi:type VI secretion protein [Pseudomonas benzopyrenica]|uniref:Type VI secretion protein n=1 Tax=Pseudomonas benzopyrenica TaxID=2993566 RepID=A0ABZ2FRE7_9PSED|nr:MULTISPECIES: type VI secretion protein [Pseudomonas]NRH42695.1 type VI secretion protein [Pseudomonas sp. MS15a(2019)]
MPTPLRSLLLLTLLALAACNSTPRDLQNYRPLGEPQTPHRLT